MQSDPKLALLRLRDTLMHGAASTDSQAQIVELDQSKVGRLSRIDALQAQAVALDGVARRETKLREITAALARLENNEYGWCELCGEAIAQGRLEFDPTVTHCIGCATQLEGNP